jgi:hypothetical protein
MHALKYLLAALAALATYPAQASCLDYGPMSLTGTVVRQTYAGPPDYESVTKGDQPIVIYVLQLDDTLCLVESTVVAQNTREVQLQWSAGGPEPFRDLLGRKVTFTGELIRGGAKHDKRVVLVATELRK